jgi:hypothetical protein
MSQISLQENDTKLDGIEANANNYSHPTGNGNNHIPVNGSAGQLLQYSSAGTATWADFSGGATFPEAPTWNSPQNYYTSSGSWTKPGSIAADDWVIFYAIGGGGGAGWTNTYTGGPSGATVLAVLGDQIPSSVSFTIGAAGGSGGHNSGAVGGTTTVTIGSQIFTAAGGGAAPYLGYGGPGASQDKIITSDLDTWIPTGGTSPWTGGSTYAPGRGTGAPTNSTGTAGFLKIFY